MSAYQIFAFSSQQALDTAASVVSGATLTFSLTGTSTPANAYSDSALTTPVANPLSADAAGVFIPVFLDPSVVYRVVLKTQAGAVLETWDPANEAVLTTASFSALYFLTDDHKITAAEIAATVTPVNYAYAPGVVDRYGTNTTPGTTDMSAALIAAFASVGVGGEISFLPGGLYMLHANNGIHNILASGKTSFSVRGHNATIRAFSSDPVTAGNEMLYLTACTDVTIEDLIVDGNRAGRGVANASCFNINIQANCQRVTFRNVRCINAPCDGFEVVGVENTPSTYPTDILFDSCTADNCYRNGMALITSLRVTVRGGRYVNTIGGFAQSVFIGNGIDIEPDVVVGSTGNTDTLIDGVEVSGNAYFGLSLNGSVAPNTRTIIRGLHGTGNGNFADTTHPSGFIGIANCAGLDIDGLFIGPHTTWQTALVHLQNGTVADVSIRNVDFRGCINATANRFLYLDFGAVTGRVRIDGFRVYNSLLANGNAWQNNGATSLSNVEVDGGAGNLFVLNAADTVVRNFTARGVTGPALYLAAADITVDGATLIDCIPSGGRAIQVPSGGVGAVLENIDLIQTGAMPGGGAVGILFQDVPKLVSNVRMKDSGTGFTAANCMTLPTFSTTVVTTTIQNCVPMPTPPVVPSAAALTVQRVGSVASITGTTGITSMTATGMDGYIVTLTFSGILTVTNGSNLKLASNFTTASGSALTLAGDGTNFYEVGRKA